MSDLISREVVIDVLKQTGIIQDNDLGHLVIDEINRIPTAFDIKKVVAELEDKSSNYKKSYKSNGKNTYKTIKAISKNKAINIVRKGGVE